MIEKIGIIIVFIVVICVVYYLTYKVLIGLWE